MEIATQVSRKILAEDGREVTKGTLCEFTVEDRSLIGVYQEITNHGSLKFQNTVHKDVFYTVAPRVIGTLRIVANDTKVETPEAE